MPGRARFEAVVLGLAGDAAATVEAAGGRVMGTLAWNEAGELDRIEGRPVLLVEAMGVDADVLAEGLPRVAAISAARELPVIVALDDAQIDLVSAELLGARVHHVCLPTMSERLVVLVEAAHELSRDAVGAVGETEDDRFARLNDELARIADLLAQLVAKESRTAASPSGIASRGWGYGAPPAEGDAALVDAGEIRRVIRARRLRERAFGERLFEDPAWDILLDLFAAWLERAEVSVSSLCIAAAVAPTTALRWIGRMTATGLLVRERDPFDGRRALISLSDTALGGMRSYVAMLRVQGLPFV